MILRPPFALVVTLSCLASVASALAQSEASADVRFSRFDGGTALQQESLRQYEGKLIALYYFSPW